MIPLLRFCCLFWLVLFCHISFAQSNQLNGILLDYETKQPIEGVHVLIDQNKTGATTDKDGKFTLEMPSFPADLICSHIAYQEEFFLVKKMPEEAIEIFLFPKINLLEEVVISSEIKVESFSEIQQYSVEDFEVVQGKILRLEYHGSFKDYRLSLLDFVGNKVDSLELLKIKNIEGLYQSCSNSAFVITEAEAIPIFFDSHGMYLQKAMSRVEFQNFIQPCQGLIEGMIYYLFEKNNGLLKKIQQYEIATKNLTTLRIIADDHQLANYEEELSYIKKGGKISNIRTNNEAEHCKIRTQQAEADFLSRVYYKPEYPVHTFVCNNQLVVFNHPEGTIETYDSGTLSNEVSIAYPAEKSWKKILINDHKTEEVYGLFNHKEGVVLRKIDLTTGSLEIEALVKTNDVELKKIQVYNNHLFYLEENENATGRKELIKQALN